MNSQSPGRPGLSWLRARRHRLGRSLVVALGVVTVGAATEANTAQTITARHARTLGQVTEADTAQALRAIHVRTLTRASEADTAQAVVARHVRTLGQVTEADVAKTVSRGAHLVAIGATSEADTARTITRGFGGLVQPIETDLAAVVTIRRTRALVATGETDLSRALTGSRKSSLLTGASTTELAAALTSRHTRAVGQASSSETATPVTAAAIGSATARAGAQPPLRPDKRIGKAPAVWFRQELPRRYDAARPPAAGAVVAVALEANTAQAFGVSLTRPIEQLGARDVLVANRAPGQSPGSPGLSWLRSARPRLDASIPRVAMFLAVAQATEGDSAKPIAVIVPLPPQPETIGARERLQPNRAPGQSPGPPGLAWLHSRRPRPYAFLVQGLTPHVVALAQASSSEIATPVGRHRAYALSRSLEADLAQGVGFTRNLVAVVQAHVETDLAKPIRPESSAPILRVAETDLATALTPRKVAALVRAAETDTASTLAPRKTRGLAQVLELDQAGTVARPGQLFIGVNTATSAELARALSVAPRRMLGAALESDLAAAIPPRKRGPVAASMEIDLARALAHAKTGRLAQATSTELARPVSPSRSGIIIPPLETDLPHALTPRHSRSLVRAFEADQAQSVVSAAAHAVVVVRATETDVARAVTWRIRRLIARGSELDVTAGVTGRHARTLVRSAETDAAGILQHSKRHSLAGSAETDLARAVSVRVRRFVAPASELDQSPPVLVPAIHTIGRAHEIDTAAALIVTTGSLGSLLPTHIERPRVTLEALVDLQTGAHGRVAYTVEGPAHA